ncbi:MAG TPA: type VI secretion system tip protein TssI/VgrG, partial [Tepidisphaeraceae bacterium]|nr:type VI secretion system tip protein TssI/VgrG [Tepidisphaeraceae bacterium]
GPEGEEIHTDKYGRIKVQFHWMRVSDNEDDEEDEKGSCWIRVAQPWAGKSWGTVFLPRIGQEVVVSFLEGDPDQPLITGAVYNAEAMPPYALPDNKTRSCIKTDSSKGGGGFNEIRFEDKKGSEELFIHAEKNLNMHIKNNVYEQVNNEVHITIDKKKSETVKEDREETVVKCHTESIGKTRSLTIGENEAKSVGGTHSFTVTKDVKEKFDANHAETVKEEYYLKAKDIIIEGTDSITIKVKNNFIAIDSSGISVGADQPNGTVEVKSKGDTTVKSTMGLTMGATAAAGLKGTASLTLESPAATTVKGAMVKIN